MSEEETILGIPISLIRSRRNLIGVWRAFGVSSKEAFDALRISDERMAEYLAESYAEKAVSEDEEAVSEDESDAEQARFAYVQKLYERREVNAEDIERHERAVEEKFGLYLQDFEAPLEPDINSLHRLASIDVWLEKIQSLKIQYVDDMSPVARKNRSALIEEETKLSTQARLLQKSLGIDRATRDKRRKSKSDADTVIDIVKAADEWMNTQTIQVYHCGIKLAFLYLPFPELWDPLVTSCPRCKQEVRVEIPLSEIEEPPHIE